MNPEFQKALIDFLMRYHKVSIPALGKFYLISKSNDAGSSSTLHPHNYVLEHHTNGQDNLTKFEEYLMNIYKFGKDNAKQFIKQSVSQIYEVLKHEDKLVCNDLGEFRLDGEVIKFIAYNEAINNESYGLPVVKLIPILRTYDEKKNALEKNISVTKKAENKSNFWEIVTALFLSLIIIGLLGLLATLLMSENSNNQELNNLNNSPQTSLNNSNGASVILTDSSLYSSQYDAINTTSLDTYDNEIIIPDENSEEIVEKAYNHPCIIIVGSFKNKDNQYRMVEELYKMGYDVHEEQYNEFNRVGVRFDCLTNDLYNMLYVLRGKIDEGAWILKY